MSPATQSSAALMGHKKSELVDEVLALRQQLGEMEAAKDGPSVADASNEIAVALTDAVEHLRDAFVIYDAKGHLVHCNENFREFYDYTVEQTAPGVLYDDLVQLDIKRGTIAADPLNGDGYSELRLKQRDFVKGTITFQLADGRWVEVRERPTSAGGIVSIQNDISERKRLEDGLRESEAIKAEAVQIAQLGHWTWDEIEDKCTYCSEECARIHGCSREDYLALVTSTEADIMFCHPEDRDRVEAVFQDARDNSTAWDVEFRIVRPDGIVRHIREIGNPVFDDDGRLIQSIGTVQDITDAKQSAEALRESEEIIKEAVKIAHLGHWIWDEVEDRCTYCSEECALIHGISQEEYLAQMTSTDADSMRAHPDDRERLKTDLRKAQANLASWDVEYRVVRPDGTVRHIRELGRQRTVGPLHRNSSGHNGCQGIGGGAEPGAGSRRSGGSRFDGCDRKHFRGFFAVRQR